MNLTVSDLWLCLFASIILYVSPFCLSSNQPVFISHSLNILSLLRRSLFSIFFTVTRTLSVHSFTHSPELSLSLYFLYLCSLRSLISNRVTANSWSVSSTPSLYRVPWFNLHPFFLHLSLSFSQAVWRLCISVYCTVFQELWTCELFVMRKKLGSTTYIIYWH